ncbi:uncharacterized protein KD926_006147 [Aspergillus affinis]|uniref:uncharacterized protein n=1 Tax=Aspergillus affinis TaxID=1070780 RepID=UPI0022FE82F7|nr:uncharacterized protein KD926_006147 [Aspergillus affinis]KAI9042023.1 hypothetical protein KD926_006147 [Aspergillus affinis]
MGDFPGLVEAGAAPDASQPLLLDLDHHDLATPATPATPANDSSADLQRQKTQQKRSSLPARPHGAARHAKRLTLNFPINIPPNAFESGASTPASMTPITRPSALQSPAALPLDPPLQFADDQDDGSGLLTAIASQERRVLELREELSRAETELDSLKKQWAVSEKTKKRTEINQRAEPLIPLRSPDRPGPVVDETARHYRDSSVGSSESPSSAAHHPRFSRELGRRQSMRAAAAKGTTVSTNGRRVFQGSHTRALSLLSPVPGTSTFKQEVEESVARVGRPPRSATLPSVERSPMAVANLKKPDDQLAEWKTMPPPSREALVRTGKQMASDLREGLWTFLEDIRQATVGEEGINATESRAMAPPRPRDSSSASRSRDRLSVQGSKASRSPSSSSSGAKTSGKDSKSADIDSSFWSEFGIDPTGQKSPNARAASGTNTRGADESNNLEVDDNWGNDDWDTPQPKKMHTPSSSRSTLESKHDQSPMTQGSSPRTSASFGEWRPIHDSSILDPSVADGIPWPAIAKGPSSKLTRTASNLMAEWERSLSGPNSPTLDKDDKTD